MSINPVPLQRTTEAERSASVIHPGWRGAGLTLVLSLALVVFLFWDGFSSMVSVWWNAETYTHGFIIAPLSAFLIWRRRTQWLAIAPRPYWAMLVPMLLIGVMWWMARTIDLTGGLHACAVLMVMASTAFVVGKRVSRVWAFPLLFLLFAIPFGEFLLPPLMGLTADFTVLALQLVGIPVFREGLSFNLPSGQWSVVEACSGLRYLINSLALGTVYAYLSYRRWPKRLAFIAVSAIVPLLANWLRAFFIVLLGHVSNMRLATGVDHLIYGWVFFLVVTFVLFWIGNRWRDEEVEPPTPALDAVRAQPSLKPLSWGLVAVLLLAITAGGPLAAHWTQERVRAATPLADFSAWEPIAENPSNFSDFHPEFKGWHSSWSREFEQNGRQIGLFSAYYIGQDAPKRKLISVTNKLVTTLQYQTWSVIEEHTRRVSKNTVIESEIRGPVRLLAWHWYTVCGHTTTSQVWAKWLQWRCVASYLRDDAAVTVVYTPIDGPIEQSREYLRAFVSEHYSVLQEAIQGQAGQKKQ